MICRKDLLRMVLSKEENNIRYLEKKMADYKAGKLKVEEHELIEE